MKNDNLTSLNFACLLAFPILSLFSGIGTYNIIKIANVDSYISVIFSYLIGFLCLLLFLYIFNYKKELNIIEKNKLLFGNILGTIINYIIGILFFTIGVILIYNISNFAISQFLAETPLLIFMLVIGFILIYNVNLGIENISRVSIIFFGIIFLLTIISTTGILKEFKTSNLLPILEYGIIPPLKGGITLTLTNVIPIFILLIIEKNKITSPNKLNKYLLFFYTIAFIFIFLTTTLTIGTLGINLSKLYQYPEYTVLKKISILNFIERIENFIYVKWILSSFISLSLIIYYTKNTIKEKSNKLLPTIITILLIITSLTIFKNNTIFYQITYNIFPIICLLLFLIYIIIGINILIRKIFQI